MKKLKRDTKEWERELHRGMRKRHTEEWEKESHRKRRKKGT